MSLGKTSGAIHRKIITGISHRIIVTPLETTAKPLESKILNPSKKNIGYPIDKRSTLFFPIRSQIQFLSDVHDPSSPKTFLTYSVLIN